MMARTLVAWSHLSRRQQFDILRLFEWPMAITSYAMVISLDRDQENKTATLEFFLCDLDVVTIVGEQPEKPRAMIELAALPMPAMPFRVEIRLTQFGRGALYMLREAGLG